MATSTLALRVLIVTETNSYHILSFLRGSLYCFRRWIIFVKATGAASVVSILFTTGFRMAGWLSCGLLVERICATMGELSAWCPNKLFRLGLKTPYEGGSGAGEGQDETGPHACRA